MRVAAAAGRANTNMLHGAGGTFTAIDEASPRMCAMKTTKQPTQGRPASVVRCMTVALHLLVQFTRAGWAQRHLSLFPTPGRSAARSVLNMI